jgi:DNA-binding CsgD family transcriptional regulator
MGEVGQPRSSTGIDPVGDLSWGSHVCLFYETSQDLIGTNSDYFAAGLKSGEFCIWALSDPVAREEAIAGLRESVPDFDSHLEAGHIELIPSYKWYLRGSKFDSRRIIDCWHAKLTEALAKGFAGMRVSGNAFWLESNLWDEFQDYEEELDRSLEGRRMIVLCTYPLYASRSVDLLDVARTHQFSIAKRNGRWEFFETPELAEVRREIARLDGANNIRCGPFPGHGLLTPRERVVLAQIVKGASAKESARTLGISPRTVEFHRSRIMHKLGARSVAELLSKVILGSSAGH